MTTFYSDSDSDIEDYGYPTQATIDLPHTEFPGGQWVEELVSFDDGKIGIDPATGEPIYQDDRCFVGYDGLYCDVEFTFDIYF